MNFNALRVKFQSHLYRRLEKKGCLLTIGVSLLSVWPLTFIHALYIYIFSRSINCTRIIQLQWQPTTINDNDVVMQDFAVGVGFCRTHTHIHTTANITHLLVSYKIISQVLDLIK